MYNQEEVSAIATKYHRQLIDTLTGEADLQIQSPQLLIDFLLAKVGDGRRKLSLRMPQPEIALLYQLLAQQDLQVMQTDAQYFRWRDEPYQLIGLKNPEPQVGEKYFRLDTQVQDGKIMENTPTGWISYSGKEGSISGLPKKISFVINTEGELRLGAGHYFLIGNQPMEVLGAGVMRVRAGKVINIMNDSNHFRPSRLGFISSLRFLANLQILHPELIIDEIPNTLHS